MAGLYILTVCLTWLLTVCLVTSDMSLKETENIFKNYTHWVGTYIYDEKGYYITMETLLKEDGAVFGKFKDEEGAMLDTAIHVYAGMRVTITKIRVTKPSAKFPDSGDFMVDGRLHPSKVYKGWIILGNVTLPKDGLFTGFRLHADHGEKRETTPVNKSLRIGLTVGLSLGLGLLGVGLMVGMTVWAIRKGYLRHVPGTYSTFRNERTAFSAKENSLHI